MDMALKPFRKVDADRVQNAESQTPMREVQNLRGRLVDYLKMVDSCEIFCSVIDRQELEKSEMEILSPLGLELFLESISDIIDRRDPAVEIVLTGRGATDELIELADLVTEMKDVKHPFDEGLSPRRGIEY